MLRRLNFGAARSVPRGPERCGGLLTAAASRCILLIVLVVPKRDRVAERREATRGEILEAAWQLAEEQGLAEFTLRDLAERVGMRAPSLYTHFASKNAIYDAMFGQAWSDYEQIALTELAELPQTPRAAIRRVARVFFDFAVANPARHQLMNQRTIPGFVPSLDSYAPAVRALEMGKQIFRNLGLKDPADFDISTAIIAGLINQQIANDPGGTRWSALLERTFDVWADGLGLPPDPPAPKRRPTQPRRQGPQPPATRSIS